MESESSPAPLHQVVGQLCWRKPCGRKCRILKESEVKLLIKDGNYATWVNKTTFYAKWDLLPNPEVCGPAPPTPTAEKPTVAGSGSTALMDAGDQPEKP